MDPYSGTWSGRSHGHWCDIPRQTNDQGYPSNHRQESYNRLDCRNESCNRLEASGRMDSSLSLRMDCNPMRQIDPLRAMESCSSLRQMEGCSMRPMDSCSLRQMDSCSSLRQMQMEECSMRPVDCRGSLRHIPEACPAQIRQLAEPPGCHGSLRQLDSPFHPTCPVHSPFRFRFANGGPEYYTHHQVIRR